MTHGDSKVVVKMCASCLKLLPGYTLICPHCSGILFKTVKLDEENHNDDNGGTQ